jgi:hypothetical protein
VSIFNISFYEQVDNRSFADSDDELTHHRFSAPRIANQRLLMVQKPLKTQTTGLIHHLLIMESD